MAVSVVMPALEMAQETGKIVSWLKKEGDKITKGEALLEVETDKAVVEIEAPGDGVLAGVKQTEGAVVPVGQTIAWIVAPGEKAACRGGSGSDRPRHDVGTGSSYRLRPSRSRWLLTLLRPRPRGRRKSRRRPAVLRRSWASISAESGERVPTEP